jgi:hypothetical protein
LNDHPTDTPHHTAYPDTHCVYQVLVMIGTTSDKIFRIKGGLWLMLPTLHPLI